MNGTYTINTIKINGNRLKGVVPEFFDLTEYKQNLDSKYTSLNILKGRHIPDEVKETIFASFFDKSIDIQLPNLEQL